MPSGGWRSEVKEEGRNGPGDIRGVGRAAAASPHHAGQDREPKKKPPGATTGRLFDVKLANHTVLCAMGVSGTGYPAAPKVETMALCVSKYTCQ